MEIQDWPMDTKTWKKEYFRYEEQYRLDMLEKYNISPIMRKFMTNTTALNHILLKSMENSKYIDRLQKRINNYKEKLEEIQTEIENTEDNQESEKLELEKDVFVSPTLLEASEKFLLNQAEEIH